MRAHGIDSPFHIATILGISIDDWDILAPHSGLFDSSNRILKEHIWGRKLQLEVEFRDFKTLSSTGAQEQSLWFRFVGLPRIADQRTSRSNPMTSSDERGCGL